MIVAEVNEAWSCPGGVWYGVMAQDNRGRRGGEYHLLIGAWQPDPRGMSESH